MSREILITERMDLHLVWSEVKTRIFIKPLPRFLLEPCFWSAKLGCEPGCSCATTGSDCPRKVLWKRAFGFLLSYTALVRHESDFWLAKEKRLLPSRDDGGEDISWQDWRAFVAQLDPGIDKVHSMVDKRWHYGEIDIGFILMYSSNKRRTEWKALQGTTRRSFVQNNFNLMISALGLIVIVLTAMQTGLGTSALGEDEAFQSASYGFTIFSMVAIVVMSVAVVVEHAIMSGLQSFREVRERRSRPELGSAVRIQTVA
ncbi:hypothetical protein B0T17DRAFT_543820 [Bombardia bombarda]|uniref:Uncharacterized protein n=1 Tax=Bombardia bombarda TaxID=252184 RepID=A0AA39T2A8_9PEZI|nr:hypothetical protein B0T17DRAFT_543820 [Bombardia bombarda]